MFDAKFVLVKNKTKKVDKRVDAILANSDPILVDAYSKALTLNSSQLKKGYVEASLLCETDLSKISEVLDVPVPILEVYKEFFFEVEGLDKLSKIEHIETVEDDNEKSLKLWALGQGLNFISWRIGNKVTLSPVTGLEEMYSMCLYKSREAVYSGNYSESSKEAIKWTKLAADVARLLKVWTLDNDAAKADLNIAIREIVPSFRGIDSLLKDNELNGK